MGRATIRGFIAVALATASLTAHAAGPPRRHVIIVANNVSRDEGVAPLAYADDDGARYFELFRAAGAEVTLLTVLDPAAQRRYPEAARAALPPTRRELGAALSATFQRLQADRKAGRETHLYFVYSGHGNVGPNREGYVHLLDAPFRRSDLFREVLARSPATFNHVILDACHAFFMVRKRGGRSDKQGDFRTAVRAFLRTEDLATYPNTGVILATSSESETHEWSRWEAGIFSHELRSALLGGADVDGDGRVTYGEAAAFVEAANVAVDVPRARLRVYSRPPPLRVDLPLLEPAAFRGVPTLVVEAAHAARYHVEDARGVRLADLHPSREQPIRVALVGRAPFFLRNGAREAPLPPRERVAVGELAFGPPRASSRGGVELTFRLHLFEVPFGVGFYRAAAARSEAEPEPPPDSPLADSDPGRRRPRLRLLAWTSLAAAAAAGTAAGVTYFYATQAHDAYGRATTAAEARMLRQRAEDRLLGARVLLGVASAAAAAGATLFVLDWLRVRRAARLAPAVAAGPAGASLSLGGEF